MSEFKFQVLEMRPSAAQEWLIRWAKRYDEDSGDDVEYWELIAKHESFTADDFRRIGKWKDGATAEGHYKPNVAMVAFPIWELAAKQMPRCPDENKVAAFLEDSANRAYTDTYRSGPREKHFGLSRATALLHFISGGRYPIFDSRVRTAIARLLGQRELPDTVTAYIESYLPFFKELAELCNTTGDLRTLDKALFSYGALPGSLF